MAEHDELGEWDSVLYVFSKWVKMRSLWNNVNVWVYIVYIYISIYIYILYWYNKLRGVTSAGELLVTPCFENSSPLGTCQLDVLSFKTYPDI